MRITWYGHSNFKIEDEGVSVLVDPFFEHNPTSPVSWRETGPVDIVLVTHDHGDHVGQAVEICQATGASLGAVVGTAGKLCEAGIPDAQILNGIGFNIGGTVEAKGVRITMIPAFHTTESGTPVGYIVRMPGGASWYHAGDTGLFSDMGLYAELYPVDIALLPMGGVFTMDPRQAAVAAKLTRAKTVIPMHYGTFPVLEKNVERFAAILAETAPGCRCVGMKPGETVDL